MTLNTHPTLPEFEYFRPVSLVEASEFLNSNPGESRPFLGGTDVFVRMRDGFLTPKFLVDVKNLNGTNDLRFDPQSGLTLGAAVNMNRVIASPEVQAHYPLLAEACRSVASYQLDSRHRCWQHLQRFPCRGHHRSMFGVGSNATNSWDKRSASGIAWIIFPRSRQNHAKAWRYCNGDPLPLPPKKCSGTYIKLGRNQLSDLSIVGVTAFGHPNSSCESGYRFRLALASVAPVPLVPAEAETYLANHSITPESLRKAASLSADACTPIDDVRGSARYRKEMVRNLSARALTEVWKNLN